MSADWSAITAQTIHRYDVYNVVVYTHTAVCTIVGHTKPAAPIHRHKIQQDARMHRRDDRRKCLVCVYCVYVDNMIHIIYMCIVYTIHVCVCVCIAANGTKKILYRTTLGHVKNILHSTYLMQPALRLLVRILVFVFSFLYFFVLLLLLLYIYCALDVRIENCKFISQKFLFGF